MWEALMTFLKEYWFLEPVVNALTAWAKHLGARDPLLSVIGFCFGVLMAIFAQVAAANGPVELQTIFNGVIMGLIATGFYKAVQNATGSE